MKLYAARLKRPTPYIDNTIYVAWNAMMASAYLVAGRVFARADVVAFALKSLDRAITATWDGIRMGHVVAYGETEDTPHIAGVLDDYVFTATAALDAWEATGLFHYFADALAIADVCVAGFYDEAKGGFFDTAHDGADKIGALTARRKPLQDSPTPAGNAVAAALLLRLAELTGRDDLRDKAARTLECFAGVVEHFGLYAASYGLALRRLVTPPVQVVVVGAAAEADALEQAALAGYAVTKSVLRVRAGEALPPSLAQTIPHLPQRPGSFAVVCSGFTCGLPLTSAEDVYTAIRS